MAMEGNLVFLKTPVLSLERGLIPHTVMQSVYTTVPADWAIGY